MSDLHHRPGVYEAYLVKRHLKLEDLDADFYRAGYVATGPEYRL